MKRENKQNESENYCGKEGSKYKERKVDKEPHRIAIGV